MPEATAAHYAAAAEAVTGGPMLERDIVARVAQLLAAQEADHADAAIADARRRLAADALASPRLVSIASALRVRGWQPPAGFTCGCNPAAGLCPSHAALRDVEALTVDRAPAITVERMARAIYEADPDHTEGGEVIPWDRWREFTRDHYRRLAEAALRVVTEPADGAA